MKKVVLIGLVIVGGMVVSCEKQDFTPENCNHNNVPKWEERKCVAPAVNDNSGGNTNSGTGTEGTGGSITDPNNDEDGNGRKKV